MKALSLRRLTMTVLFSAQTIAPAHLAWAVQGERSERFTLTDKDIQSAASVMGIKIDGNSEIVLDNNQAFEAKLNAIRGATKTIEMIYYIYATDESTSVITKELLRKAKNEGVQVRILVDYIVNYANLDLFQALERESQGRLQVRLYNRPTENIIADSVYMTTKCSDKNNVPGSEGACRLEKLSSQPVKAAKALRADQLRNHNSGFSGIFLSGLYGKSAASIVYALTVGGGVKIEDYKDPNSGPLTPEKKEGLKKLVKTYLDMKQGSLSAGIKLKIAMSTMPEVEMLVKLLDKILPTGQDAYNANRGNDWDHLTDFTHHKLLLTDNKKMVMGGRNLENSYHMAKNPSGKYTFSDTDAVLTIDSKSGQAVQATFSSLWNFTQMVASLAEVQTHAPNDFNFAYAKCQKDQACLQNYMVNAGQNRLERQNQALALMNERAAQYEQMDDAVKKDQGFPVFAIEPTAKISYLEVLPFDKNISASKRVRHFGTGPDDLLENGRNIHHVLVKGLLNTCGTGKAETVYFHNAYVILPSPILSAFGEMTKVADMAALKEQFSLDSRFERDFFEASQKLDCSNVTIKVITNSIGTTDLAVINIFARHQMHTLLQKIELAKKRDGHSYKGANIQVYEMQISKDPEAVRRSLHSKVTILGDKMILGSANADLRSEFMDTNNAILIQSAPLAIGGYRTYLEGLIADHDKTLRMDTTWKSELKSFNPDADIEAQVRAIFAYGKANGKGWAKDARIPSAVFTFQQLVQSMRAAASQILNMPTNIDQQDEQQIRGKMRRDSEYLKFINTLDQAREVKRKHDDRFKFL